MLAQLQLSSIFYVLPKAVTSKQAKKAKILAEYLRPWRKAHAQERPRWIGSWERHNCPTWCSAWPNPIIRATHMSQLDLCITMCGRFHALVLLLYILVFQNQLLHSETISPQGGAPLCSSRWLREWRRVCRELCKRRSPSSSWSWVFEASSV